MTTHRLTSMAQVSAITLRCQDTVTTCKAFRQARKCLTTCHSLIKAQHGTRWMTLIMTQTQMQTSRKLPISWMCEARRRRGLFFELLFGPVTVHCIPHLYTTIHCSHCSMRTRIAHPRTISADLRNRNTILCPALYWSQPS